MTLYVSTNHKICAIPLFRHMYECESSPQRFDQLFNSNLHILTTLSKVAHLENKRFTLSTYQLWTGIVLRYMNTTSRLHFGKKALLLKQPQRQAGKIELWAVIFLGADTSILMILSAILVAKKKTTIRQKLLYVAANWSYNWHKTLHN